MADLLAGLCVDEKQQLHCGIIGTCSEAQIENFFYLQERDLQIKNCTVTTLVVPSLYCLWLESADASPYAQALSEDWVSHTYLTDFTMTCAVPKAICEKFCIIKNAVLIPEQVCIASLHYYTDLEKAKSVTWLYIAEEYICCVTCKGSDITCSHTILIGAETISLKRLEQLLSACTNIEPHISNPTCYVLGCIEKIEPIPPTFPWRFDKVPLASKYQEIYEQFAKHPICFGAVAAPLYEQNYHNFHPEHKKEAQRLQKLTFQYITSYIASIAFLLCAFYGIILGALSATTTYLDIKENQLQKIEDRFPSLKIGTEEYLYISEFYEWLAECEIYPSDLFTLKIQLLGESYYKVHISLEKSKGREFTSLLDTMKIPYFLETEMQPRKNLAISFVL